MSPPTLLILGGYGTTGRLLSSYLLRHTRASLVLAGPRPHRAREEAEALRREVAGARGGEEAEARVKAREADASRPETLAGALEGCHWLVAASSTARFTPQLAAAALDARADYFDLQHSPAKVRLLKEMEPRIVEAGRCFVMDGGFHPGLPAALVRAVAPAFDGLQVARVGSAIRQDWRGLELADATVDEFLRELLDFDTSVFREGEWRRPGWWGVGSTVTMDFGPPLGRRACVPMGLEEMRALPGAIPTLRDTGFYIAGWGWVVDWGVFPLAALTLAATGGRVPSWLRRLFRWSVERGSRPPFLTALQVEASGVKGGRPHRELLAISHQDAYHLTAISAAATFLQLLEGSVRRPGLWTQGNLVDPKRLLEDMARMGVRIRKGEE